MVLTISAYQTYPNVVHPFPDRKRRNGQKLMIYTNTTAILAHLIKASADLYRRPMRAAAGHNSDLSEAAPFRKTVPCEVAHQFYVSERSITQTLRKMGVSFYRCVTPRHLISAKVLIEQGISMEAVAESVGLPITSLSSVHSSRRTESVPYNTGKCTQMHNRAPLRTCSGACRYLKELQMVPIPSMETSTVSPGFSQFFLSAG